MTNKDLTQEEIQARHVQFNKKVKESQYAVWLGALWWVSMGYKVEIPPTMTSEKHENRMSTSDGGDFFLYAKEEPYGRQRIEVKRISRNFSGLHDWPFPDFILDGKDKWDRMDVAPLGTMTFSKSFRFFGAVKNTEFEHKFVEKRFDPLIEAKKDYYILNLKHVTWYSTEHLLSSVRKRWYPKDSNNGNY